MFWRRGLAAAVAILALGIGALGADDPKLAQSLMEAGKKALEEGDLDTAFSAFEKAGLEDKSLFEYQYWQGVVSEKRGDVRFAIASYETFLRNFESANRLGVSVPPPTIPLAKKARARLEVIAAGPNEQTKLEDALIVKLLDGARSASKQSPQAARRAARWVLRMRSGHEGATALLAELGDAAPVAGDEPGGSKPAPSEVFADVPGATGSKSLLLSQVFAQPRGWSWAKVGERWVATVDTPVEGAVFWPTTPIPSGTRFVYELEARVLTEHKLDWAIGPSFGKRDDLVVAFFQRTQVVATRAAPSKGFVDIAGNGLTKGLDPTQWHRLCLTVDGTKLTVWLNGTKMLDKDVPFLPDLVGSLGLWSQGCKVEVRTLRFGVLP